MLGSFLLNSALIISPNYPTPVEYLPRPIVPSTIRYFAQGVEPKTEEDWGNEKLCDFENKNWQGIFESIIEIADEIEVDVGTTFQGTMQSSIENPNEYTVCILQTFKVLNNFLNACLDDFYILNPQDEVLIAQLILGELEPEKNDTLEKHKDLAILCLLENGETENFSQMDPKIQWGFVSQIFKKLETVRKP